MQLSNLFLLFSEITALRDWVTRREVLEIFRSTDGSKDSTGKVRTIFSVTLKN